MNRRQFLKTGLIGGAILAAGGAWVVWRDIRTAEASDPPRDHLALVTRAVAPVILAGMLPGESASREAGIGRVIDGVRTVVAAFTPAVRREAEDLFRLLDIRTARRVLTGVSHDWPAADPAEVAAFLERWRRSPIALLQSGYFALHDLVLGAWYADASAWEAIGYAGPPNVD